jgi:hypothetical protein
MSFGAGSGKLSAATSSLRLVTVTVRAGDALEPPVVPWGRDAIGSAPQPSFSGRTSRPGSGGGTAARAVPSRKPMDSMYANARARQGKNIDFSRENC